MGTWTERKRKLAKLREWGSHAMAGARQHRFELAPPLDEQVIAAFEQRFGVRLPDGYRSYLIEAGNGGAGPFSGLRPLRVEYGEFEPNPYTKQPMKTRIPDLRTPFPFSHPVEVSPEEWEKIEAEMGSTWEQWAEPPGALCIGDEEDGHWIWLVVTGDLAGVVWGTSYGSGWRPWQHRDGRPMDFGAWYDAWLDAALASREFEGCFADATKDPRVQVTLDGVAPSSLEGKFHVQRFNLYRHPEMATAVFDRHPSYPDAVILELGWGSAVWDLATGDTLWKPSRASDLSWTSDGDVLLLRSTTVEVRAWPSLELVQSASFPKGFDARSVSRAPGGEHLVSGLGRGPFRGLPPTASYLVLRADRGSLRSGVRVSRAGVELVHGSPGRAIFGSDGRWFFVQVAASDWRDHAGTVAIVGYVIARELDGPGLAVIELSAHVPETSENRWVPRAHLFRASDEELEVVLQTGERRRVSVRDLMAKRRS